MSHEKAKDCCPLRDDEFDGLGNRKDAIAIECIEHIDLMGKGWRFWVARCPSLPGYDGEGMTPAEALSALQGEFSSRPIYRIKPPKDEAKTVARWRERGRRARAATAALGGRNKSSEAIGATAAEYKVRKSEVAKLNNAVFAHTQYRIGPELTKEKEAEMRAHIAAATNSPGIAAAIEAMHDNDPPHRLLKRWAREKFPQT